MPQNKRSPTNPPKKKFTVVLGERVGYGASLTYYKHIEAESVAAVYKKYDCAIWFVFPGWQEPVW